MFRRVIILFIKAYQWGIRPLMGQHCRFEPSCSHYALEAVQKHGLCSGFVLTTKRVCRCHPWNEGGFDPVP